VNDHQVRVLARIAGVIDNHRGGGSSPTEMFDDIWGLISAAELKGSAQVEVEDLYYAASLAHDASQPWMPANERTTQADVDAALDRLRSWASGLHSATGDIPDH
jgi:hypothetical protein